MAILRLVMIGILANAGLAPIHAGQLLLTRAAEIRSLSRQAASRNLPVRLRGVVVLRTVSGVFLNDGETGIWARLHNPPPALAEGTLLEAEGTTNGIGYTPRISISKFKILGTAPLPEAKRVSLERLLAGTEDAQRIELEGVIQKVVPVIGPHPPLFVLAIGRQFCRVKITDTHEVDPTLFTDARVRVRGIFQPQVNLRNQSVGLEMHTRLADVEILIPPPGDPFQAPLTPTSEIMAFSPIENAGHRRVVAGVVTFIYPGKFFYIRDGDTSVRIDTPGDHLKPGDRVELASFPSFTHTLASLTGAVIRKTGSEPPPQAAEMTPRQICSPHLTNPWGGSAETDASGALVNVKGRLVRVIAHPENTMKTLLVESGGEIFPAYLPAFATSKDQWVPGSELDLTGACELEFHKDPGNPQSITHPISGFHLWLASAEAVRVLRTPSWWTPGRLNIALCGLAGVLLIAAVWLILLRREVARRGYALAREIAARRETKLEFETTLRERTRLAHDLHDNLEQTLIGLSMQLQAAELFQGEQNAKRSIRHLKLAQQFLDRTREDLHRTVWDLRAFGPEGKSLTDALRDKARTMSEGNPVCITVEETGTPRRLPDFIAGNLLLIAQEAVTNALKHAGASTIAVQVTHHETGVMVSIRDDGKGFDPATVPDHHEGHFGLLGMRERAKRLGGTLEIVSTPGSGTRIEMQLPASDFREKNANY